MENNVHKLEVYYDNLLIYWEIVHAPLEEEYEVILRPCEYYGVWWVKPPQQGDMAFIVEGPDDVFIAKYTKLII